MVPLPPKRAGPTATIGWRLNRILKLKKRNKKRRKKGIWGAAGNSGFSKNCTCKTLAALPVGGASIEALQAIEEENPML